MVAQDVYRVREQIHSNTLRPAKLKHRKAGEFREVPLPRSVREAMARYGEKHGTTKDGYLLRGPGGYFTERRNDHLCRDGGPEPDSVGGIRAGFGGPPARASRGEGAALDGSAAAAMAGPLVDAAEMRPLAGAHHATERCCPFCADFPARSHRRCNPSRPLRPRPSLAACRR
ncbi:hypothetical protein ACFCZV_34220 [Streptomyces hydrogenans]|uniref:hypothetical protein n=1 Tax=Streptomyces hydrogenans TaxID=1873719 RepID=UPI0035DF6E60